MDNSRQAIFARLGKSANTARTLPDFNGTVAQGKEEKIKRFTQLITQVHAEVHRVNAVALPTMLTQLLQDKGCGHIAADATALARYGVKDLQAEVPGQISDHDWFHHIDAGISSTEGLIAETGSLILFPSIAEPRRVSLVPPVHLALVDTRQCYDSLAQAMQDWPKPLPGNVVLVSGPSKTADIEQVLAYGVHGPKQLVVVLVDGL